MKLVLHMNDFAWPVTAERLGQTLAAIGRAGEAAGFSGIAVMDHAWQHPIMGGPDGKAVLEAYSSLAFLAANTSSVNLTTLATPASYRVPAMLAKTVTTLDVLSGGRAWLGIGAGDYEAEAQGLGIPYPSLAERFELVEETIQVCLKMWSGEDGDQQPFHGKHVQLERALNVPQSLTRPHPPIMIAGDGEKKTLPLVAKYGDACNIKPGPTIPQRLARLRELCDALGRDYDTIEKTCPWFFDVGESGEKAPALVEQLHAFADMGIQTVFGRVVGDYTIDPIEIMGRDVIPAVAGF
jgi:F420-dependent oxidoreductase-like protein